MEINVSRFHPVMQRAILQTGAAKAIRLNAGQCAGVCQPTTPYRHTRDLTENV